MPIRTFRVRVCLPETQRHDKFVESQQHGFTLQARTYDAAATMARARAVANGLDVRSVAHAPGNLVTIIARGTKAVSA